MMKTSACWAWFLAIASLTACQQGPRPGSDSALAGATQAGKAGTASAGAPAVKVNPENPCSVLLPQEVESILGATVPGREIVDEVTCSFEFKAPAGSASAGSGTAAPPKAPADDREAETMAKSMAAPFAGGPPRLIVKVYFKDGRKTITATRLANVLLGGPFEQIPDIGDEAWLGPMASTLLFRKGDVGVELDLRMVPDAREKGIRLAALVASRL